MKNKPAAVVIPKEEAVFWMDGNGCWRNVIVRHAVYKGRATDFVAGTPGDVLDIPKARTDLKAMRKEFFRVLTDPGLYK